MAYWHNYDPTVAPSQEADEGAFHTCQFNEQWLSIVLGALEGLENYGWVDDNGNSLDMTGSFATLIAQIQEDYSPAIGETNMRVVGEICGFAVDVEPGDEWLLCDGTTHDWNDHPDTVAAFTGTNLDNGSTFKTPNLEYRFLRGGVVGNASQEGGSNSKSLTVANLPPHDHTINVPFSQNWAFVGSVGQTFSVAGGTAYPFSYSPLPLATNSAGNGTSFDVKPAYTNLVYYIYVGAYDG